MTERDTIAAINVITVVGLVVALATVSLPWGVRLPRDDLRLVGFLDIQSAAAAVSYVPAFREGLEEAGYVEGRHVRVAYRFGDGDDQKVVRMAAELASRRVAVIAATGAGSLRSVKAVQEATSTIPALFISGVNPIQAGLVSSISRPGRNLTGVRLDAGGMTAKRLEILKELMPGGGKVAILFGPGASAGRCRCLRSQDRERAEEKLAATLDAVILRIHSALDFDRRLDDAFAAAVSGGVRGLVVRADPLFASRAGSIVALAAKHGLIAIYPLRPYVEAGGLASYGPDLVDAYRQVGMYTGRILKGAQPGDLPVASPRKWDLVINRKTAASLGLVVSPWLVARANATID